jgi:hypothetical protein
MKSSKRLNARLDSSPYAEGTAPSPLILLAADAGVHRVEWPGGAVSYLDRDGEDRGDEIDFAEGVTGTMPTWGFDVWSISTWAHNAGVDRTATIADRLRAARA